MHRLFALRRSCIYTTSAFSETYSWPDHIRATYGVSARGWRAAAGTAAILLPTPLASYFLLSSFACSGLVVALYCVPCFCISKDIGE